MGKKRLRVLGYTIVAMIRGAKHRKCFKLVNVGKLINSINLFEVLHSHI